MSLTGSETEISVDVVWTGLRDLLIETYGGRVSNNGTTENGIIEISLGESYAQPAPAPEPYSFDPFLPDSINLGVRFVYRQEWRPLGNQRGEIVKTIPLGPKQNEKISTKISRRTKATRTSENLKSTETTTESSDTTKDSSEVVEEAKKTFGWHTDAEASVKYLGFKAKISGGLEGSSAENAKETSTYLSEVMQKTASKIRTETKVVVTTESESTFETSSSSEIWNPNEEIAVTYVYSKLQRQYEVLTRLAALQTVVMVAEDVPDPGEVNYDWVKRYDWILAKVLLDDSFRDALTSISQEVQQPEQGGMANELRGVMQDTIGKLDKIAESPSELAFSDVDFIKESQVGYRETLKELAEQLRSNNALESKRSRLYEHIRQNILHYCRAIWSQEDPQQRLMRFRKRGVSIPMKWAMLPIFEWHTVPGPGGTSIEVPGVVDVFWQSVGDETMDLSELINPNGPLAYHGNYAVYTIRQEHADELVCPPLDLIKAPYLTLENTGGDRENAEEARVVVRDPLLRRYIDAYPPDAVTNEMITEVRDVMVEYVPELRLRAHLARRRSEQPRSPEDTAAWETFENDVALFRRYYPEYLFRKEQARRFLMDTNNLVVDIMPGEGSALEPFKLAHREVDVFKANEERERLILENARRRKLIEEDKLGDPDIERVTVVAGDNDLRDIVNVGLVASGETGTSENDSG